MKMEKDVVFQESVRGVKAGRRAVVLGKRKKAPPMQRCWQGEERDDCFARTRVGNCMALEDTAYPCGACPFYKPQKTVDLECAWAYDRLIRLERVDMISKYSIVR